MLRAFRTFLEINLALLIFCFMGVTSAFAATSLHLDPAMSTTTENCSTTINVRLSATDAYTNGAQMYVKHNLDTGIGENISITGAGLFDNYNIPAGLPSDTVGIFGYGGDKTGSNLTFARITIRSPSSQVGKEITLQVVNDPNELLTSKVADATTSENILTNVSGGTYTVVSGWCETTKPSIQNVNPAHEKPNHPVDDPITFNVRDTGSQIDIETLTVTAVQADVEVPLTITSTQVTSGSDTEYAVSAQPDPAFTPQVKVDWTVEIQDKAGNLRTASYSFNDLTCADLGCVAECPVCPACDGETADANMYYAAETSSESCRSNIAQDAYGYLARNLSSPLIGIAHADDPDPRAAFSLNPATGNTTENCYKTIDIKLSATDAYTNGAQIYLQHNLDTSIGESISIAGAGLFDNYNVPADLPSDTVGIFGYGGDRTGTDLTFARITIRSPSSQVGKEINLQVINDASELLTSKVADATTSENILTNVSSGTYTVVSGWCETTKPSIQDVNPPHEKPNHPVTDPITFTVRDTGSKIDIDTLTVTALQNGVEVPLVITSTQVMAGDDSEYSISAQPDPAFTPQVKVDWTVEIQDKAGNLRTASYSFNDLTCADLGCVAECPVCPVCEEPDTTPSFSGGGGGSGSSSTTTTTTETTDVVEPEPMHEAAANGCFSDVLPEEWYDAFICDPQFRSFVDGYPDGSFRPDQAINRAELIKVALSVFTDVSNLDSGWTTSFVDIDPDSWLAPFVTRAEELGVIHGHDDGLFRPADVVARAEALKVLINAAGFEVDSRAVSQFADVSDSAWFTPFVSWAENKGVVRGYGENVGFLQRGLQFGDSGEDVSRMQELLSQAGYYQYAALGEFGDTMRKAVIRLQSDYPNETLTDGWGLIGPATADKIFELAGTDEVITNYVFQPERAITRAEIAKIVNILLDFQTQGYSIYAQVRDFSMPELYIAEREIVEEALEEQPVIPVAEEAVSQTRISNGEETGTAPDTKTSLDSSNIPLEEDASDRTVKTDSDRTSVISNVVLLMDMMNDVAEMYEEPKPKKPDAVCRAVCTAEDIESEPQPASEPQAAPEASSSASGQTRDLMSQAMVEADEQLTEAPVRPAETEIVATPEPTHASAAAPKRSAVAVLFDTFADWMVHRIDVDKTKQKIRITIFGIRWQFSPIFAHSIAELEDLSEPVTDRGIFGAPNVFQAGESDRKIRPYWLMSDITQLQ